MLVTSVSPTIIGTKLQSTSSARESKSVTAKTRLVFKISWMVTVVSKSKGNEVGDLDNADPIQKGIDVGEIQAPVTVSFATFMKANKLEELKVVFHSFSGSYISLVYVEGVTLFSDLISKMTPNTATVVFKVRGEKENQVFTPIDPSTIVSVYIAKNMEKQDRFVIPIMTILMEAEIETLFVAQANVKRLEEENMTLKKL